MYSVFSAARAASPCSSSKVSLVRAGTSWSPPIPIERWIFQMGSTTPCWRNAQNHASAWW